MAADKTSEYGRHTIGRIHRTSFGDSIKKSAPARRIEVSDVRASPWPAAGSHPADYEVRASIVEWCDRKIITGGHCPSPETAAAEVGDR